MIINAKKAIARPIIAATIVLRAPSTALLSPPERIHLIPPQIRKKNAISTAASSIIVTIFEIVDERELESLQSVLKDPFVEHGFTF